MGARGRIQAGVALTLGVIGAVAVAVLASRGAENSRLYATEAPHCGGYPRVRIATTPGMCAGLVYAPTDVLAPQRRPRAPRTLLQLGPGEWLVADKGEGWAPGRGAVWRLNVTPGVAPTFRRLLGELNLPHTVARGPDGRIYLGESGRVLRFDPTAADVAASIETVIGDLPGGSLEISRHPLAGFIFARDGALLVVVGAPSDQCEPEDGAKRCAEAEGADAAGLVRRYAYLGQGRWSSTFTVFASGLRNALAMAESPSGQILAADNGIDLPGANEPYEEINLLRAGKGYGWPYCMNLSQPTPAWAALKVMDCKGPAHTPPVALLPPHSAPLGMTYYTGAMFPQLRGRLLVSLHGYRQAGGRVVAYRTDARGVPLASANARFPVYDETGHPVLKPYSLPKGADALVLTPEWSQAPGRPRGTPVGVTVAADGSIWIADELNGAIIRLAADKS